MKRLYQLTGLSYFVIILIVSQCFLTREINMIVLFNSDTMYLPAIFSDVFLLKHHFFSWYFTPAPYFFPDMLIFFLINAVVNNVFIDSLLFAIVQSILALYLMSKITYLITKKNEAVLLTHTFFLFTITFLIEKNIYPYVLILLNAFHFGSFINGLFLMMFTLLYYKKNNIKYFFMLFLISALGAASDLFFVLLYVFPMIGSLFVAKKLNNMSGVFIKNVICALLSGCTFGLIVKYMLIVDTSAPFLFSFSEAPWIRIYEFFMTFFHATFLKNIAAGMLMLAFYVTISVNCYSFLIDGKRENKTSLYHGLIVFTHFFILFSAILAIANIIFSKLCITQINTSSFRYMINVYWLPIVFCWLPLVHWLEKSYFKKYMLIFFMSTVAVCLAEKAIFHSPYQGEYYPKEARCIDKGIADYNAAHQEKIRYGISGNWQAKLVTAFSKENIVLVGFSPNLMPLLTLTTPEIYRNQYDFAVIDNSSELTRLDMPLIKEINGNPIIQFHCEPDILVMIYGQGKLQTVTRP